jgi:hypothetical protein
MPQHRSHPGFGSGPPRYPGTFLLAFRAALATLGWQATRWLGEAVACTDAEGREQVVGLENLYRRAKRTERAEWPELIAEFLRTGQQAPIDDPPQNLAEVAEQLLVRIGPPVSPRTGAPPVWSQAIEGTPLCVNLVVDFPQSMFYVTQEMLENSGKPGEEWLETALANLRARTPAEWFTTIHEESGLRQCSVGDAYDSSRVLLLDALLPEATENGFLVAIPGRDELMVLPVTGPALPFLPLLKVVAAKNHKSAPYPITDEVYWIQGGTWRRFGIDMHENQANVQPPPEFLPILEALMPENQESDGDGEEGTDVKP